MEATLTLYCCEAEHLHATLKADNGTVLADDVVGAADDYPDLKAICRDPRGRFAPCGGTNRPGGRGRTDAQRRAEGERNMEKARKLIKDIREGPQPVPNSKIIELHNHLGTMTVAQMHQIKTEHNLKASGKLKRDLQARLASRFARTPKGGSPRPSEEVPRGTFGTPKNVTFESGEAHAHATAEGFLGPGATGHDLAACAGAPDGSRVTIYRQGRDMVMVDYRGTAPYKDPDTGIVTQENYRGTRTMTRDPDGTKHIHNDIFEGKGSGLKMLGRQVENASQHGFDHIETYAAGHGSGVTGQRNPSSHFNGYYSWPRFGYQATIGRSEIGNLPPKLRADVEQHGGKISGLMATKAGRDWWLGHGSGLNPATFDLKKGSYSQRTLVSYLKERKVLK